MATATVSIYADSHVQSFQVEEYWYNSGFQKYVFVKDVNNGDEVTVGNYLRITGISYASGYTKRFTTIYDKSYSENAYSQITGSNVSISITSQRYCNFKLTNGSSTATLRVTEEKPGALIKTDDPNHNPTKEGYKFAGWKDNRNSSVFHPGDNLTLAYADDTGSATTITLIAQWEAVYTITYDAGSVSVLPTTGNGYVTLSIPPNILGYAFGGWSIGGVTYAAGSQYNLTANVTATAIWTAITYAMSFNADGGTVDPNTPTIGTYDANISMPSPTRTGYAFAGWRVTGHNTATAQYAIYPNTLVAMNTVPFDVPPPAEYGMVLRNLATQQGAIVNFKALWRPHSYGFSYSFDDGLTPSPDSPLGAYYGTPVTIPNPASTLAGYSFIGWDVTVDGSTSELRNPPPGGFVVSNLTSTDGGIVYLHARLSANTYSVTFDKGGGSGGSDGVTVTFDAALPSITPPTKTGHVFIGYYSQDRTVKFYNADGNSNVASWTTPSNATLYAEWAPNVYYVHFDTNGGTGAMDNKMFVYGREGRLPDNAFSLSGYSFDGWATSPSGGKVYSNGADMQYVVYPNDSTMVLYARWLGSAYYIEFNPNGGSTREPITAYYGDAVEIAAPTREHFIFTGWKVDGVEPGALYGTDNDPQTPLENHSAITVASPTDPVWVKNLNRTEGYRVTMTAQWERIKYTVTAENESDRWDVGISGGESSIAVPAKSGDETPSVTFEAYAGIAYNITLTFKDASMRTKEWHVPKSYGGHELSRAANTSDGRAVFSASYTFGDVEDATQTWTVVKNTVSFSHNASFMPFNNAEIPPEVSFDDDASRFAAANVKVVAQNTEADAFMGWNVDEGGDITPYGSVVSSNGDEVVVSTAVDVELSGRYQRSRVSVAAQMHSASAQAEPDSVEWVSVKQNGGAVTNVDYGQSATWTIEIPNGSSHGFAGWYDADGKRVSTSPNYVVGSVTRATTLYAKLTAEVTIDKKTRDLDPGAVGGTVTVGGVEVSNPPYTISVPIGDAVSISAQEIVADNAHFSGWYSMEGTEMKSLAMFPKSHNLVVTDNCKYAALFTSTANLFYVALYGRNAATGEYGDFCTFSVASDEAISEIEATEGVSAKTAAQNYAALSGCEVLDDPTGEDSNGRFYEVSDIVRMSVEITPGTIPGTDTPYVLKRVFIRKLPDAPSGAKEVQITEQAAFSSVVNANYAYIAEFGEVAMRTLEVRVVIPSQGEAGGVVHVGSLASNIQPFDGAQEEGDFELRHSARAIALPDNGMSFAGWYDNSSFDGQPVSTDAVYDFDITSNTTLYAKFVPATKALFKWEGSSVCKQAAWTSKVYELSKPANLTSARVDARKYPVAKFKSESFSAPDAEPTSTVDFTAASAIKSQTMRRLPVKRPERYFKVSVESDAEVDAIIIGTSGEGLAT